MNIPNYTLIQKCGEGAYGEVWLAEGLGGKKVAVKIIPDKELAEKEFDGIRKSETLPGSQYRVQILHVGKTDECLYYVMERADNVGSESEYEPATLAARIQIRRMEAEEVIELGLKLLQGIDEFHSANLYHRDIKPENIIYVDGLPKLSDIGLVCSGKDHRRSAGTLGFIPPEKVGSDSSVSSGSDDLYALGKVLYCCWTGSKPENFPVVQSEYHDEENARILNQAILRAAAKDPEQRFSSAEEFKKALSFSSEDKVAKPSVLKRIQTAIAFPDKSRYDIFLSYSHADAEFYGKHYIEEIKSEIENELYDVSCRSMVFLDTDALKYGDEWHAKIMEKLNECRVFICLLSDNYLKSQYCARERLWWGQKELREGRLLHDTSPIYYIRLGTDPFAPGQSQKIQDIFGFQTNMQPWHTGKEELKKSFIRERLSDLKSALKQHITRKLNTEKSVCTIVPGLSTSFVGRLTELKELRKLCASGRYPVIQAPGGVGKTELAVAYAYGYAEDYPEGRFMIRMEHRTSWQEALCSLAEEENVVTNLHLPDDIQTKSDEEKHKKIIAALFQKAKKGKLLLFLDNVDDPSLFTEKTLRKFSFDAQIPANLHMIATTRQALTFGLNSRAQDFLIGNLDDNACFELFCQIAGNKFPFCNSKELSEEPEYQALLEIIHLLDGHVWSLEILAGYMAENYANGVTFQKKLIQLKTAFAIHGETRRHRAENATDLLAPTLEQIKSLELGEAILESASVATFFSPDRIPTDVLSTYWQTHFKTLHCEDELRDPFQYALNTLKKFYLLKGSGNSLKMHRLTQAELKRQMEKKTLLQKLAPALESCLAFTFHRWNLFLLRNPDIFEYISEAYRAIMFPPGKWHVLFWNPSLRVYCPWHSLDIATALQIIQRYPEYAEKIHLSRLQTTSDWVELLSVCPQFSNQCRLFNWFSMDDWTTLLSAQPQFEKLCPWGEIHFSAGNWSKMLEKHPSLIGHLPKDCCDASVWFAILKANPCMSNRCPWDRLSTNHRTWAIALNNLPKLAEDSKFLQYCPWDNFDGHDWGLIPQEHTDLLSHCDFEKFSGRDWKNFLRFHPEYENRCPWEKLDFSEKDWDFLIGLHPQLIKHVPIEKIGPELWFRILKRDLQLKDRCPWDKLPADPAEWALLLVNRPEYEEKCPFERFTTGKAWAHLLQFAPEMAKHLSVKDFTGDDWCDLLGRNPQFSSICPWDSIEFSAKQWASLIAKNPAMIQYCPIEKINDAAPWFEILKVNPDYDSRCPWNSIRATAGQWGKLLKVRADLAEKCPWKTFSIGMWVNLLREDPLFANKFTRYDQFTGTHWVSLLKEQPMLCFEQHCRWDSLSGAGWANLLRRQPQYAEYCTWNKLDDKAWQWLLKMQPQFAIYRK